MDWNHNGQQDLFDSYMDYSAATGTGPFEDGRRRKKGGGCLGALLLSVIGILFALTLAMMKPTVSAAMTEKQNLEVKTEKNMSEDRLVDFCAQK